MSTEKRESLVASLAMTRAVLFHTTWHSPTEKCAMLPAR